MGESSHPTSMSLQSNNSWEPPGYRWLKCNVDTAVHQAGSVYSIRCCFQNSEGRFVHAQPAWKVANLTILEGEAWALHHAIQVAIDKDWHRVIFELDSNTLVDCISSPTCGRSEFHTLVSLIKSILVLHPDFEVKFVRRQANMAAHTLARTACSWAYHRVFGICPPCIDTILSNDMN